MRKTLLQIIFGVLLSGCSALGQAAPTATATPSRTATATLVPSPSATASSTASPTEIPSPSASPEPTASATVTASVTPSFTPSITPMRVGGFVFDNWAVVDVPESIKDGIGSPLIAFISLNNRVSIANLATALPFTGIQTLYFASPTRSFSRIAVLEVDADARLEVLLEEGGRALAYVMRDGDPRRDGLYILDLVSGFSARVLPGENPLVQRGFYSPPDWSPEGDQLALAVATGYEIDIYVYAKDGSGRTNITNHGAYDLFPRWSPDGRYIAFVSDRADCPSWIPGEPGFCDAMKRLPPTSGQVYLYEVASGDVGQISEATVSEAPYWISADLLGFASGDPFDLLNAQRRIWRANVVTGEVREVALAGSGDSASYLSETWSPGGNAVLVQIADSGNRVVLLNGAGGLIGQDADLDFPRYGMVASWSPDGNRLAIGGASGQCPFGVRVKNSAFGNVARGGVPPTMCNPAYSPDGNFIAFSGVNPRVDGRNDVYVAGANGFGAVSLTADLRGQVELIGWVGGGP